FEIFVYSVAREREALVSLDAGHGFRGDHGIDHGFFRSLNGRREDSFKQVVGKHFDVDEVIGGGGPGVGGRESDENIAGAVARNAAVAAEPERNPARQALELMRNKRS